MRRRPFCCGVSRNDRARVLKDIVQTFQVEGRDVRGRMVRLSDTVEEVLQRHGYPSPVDELVAQALVLVAMLGHSLKFDGVLTLQAKGDGPISDLVADFASPGILRAWASFDEERVARMADPEDKLVIRLLGSGHLAFTIDQGPDMDRYQGIVPLEGANLSECAQKYFDQSEQLPSAVKLAAGKRDGVWMAGGIMVQHIPPADSLKDREEATEDWRRCAVLMASATGEELLDPEVRNETLLFRLFHEDGVRVLPAEPVQFGCRCSEQRIYTMLKQFSEDERRDMADDGIIGVTCEFCSSSYQVPLTAVLDAAG